MKMLLICCFFSIPVLGQIDLRQSFRDCRVTGSVTVYDYTCQQWHFSDEADSQKETLPASTFKIINSLIALETGVISSENEVVRWVGAVDTVLYGYRPDIYRDMTVQEAFSESAGWVYIELAKKIGRDRYRYYLNKCRYGNGNLSEQGVDFWNFGSFAITPKDQIAFLKALYDEKLPFSARNMAIVKRMMVAETTDAYVIRAKTGWAREDGKHTGWWVGYLTKEGKPYFFATRLIKSRKMTTKDFADCRKSITKTALWELAIIN